MTYKWVEIGGRIRRERKALGYSLEYVAEKCDLKQYQTVSNWERGNARPSLENMLHLCDLFQCELGYLLGEYECRTRQVTDIQQDTGLTENAIVSLLNLNDREKSFLNSLLSSRSNLYFIAAAYDDFKRKAVIDYAADMGDIPNDQFITSRNDLDYSRFTLSHRFMLFAEESVNNIRT